MNTTSDCFEYTDSETYSESSEVERETFVQYATQMIDTKHKDWKKTILYSDIDGYDFTNHFFEIIEKPQYVHLYFDFDSIETIEQWDDVHNWLDTLVPVFGRYSVGGYTNNNEIGFEKMFKYIPDAHHTLSCHVVYYETKIMTNILMDLMKHTKDGYIHKIHTQCDPNVYKLNTRQLMRHVLSDKFYNRKNDKNAKTAGSFLDEDSMPSHSIITIHGDEEDIDYTKLTELFGHGQVIEEKPVAKAPTKTKKHITIDDIEYEDKLIKFTYNDMLTFLRYFDNCFNTLISDLVPLWHSPYDKDFLLEVVQDWYNEVEHSKPEQATDIINRYYEREDTNKWFFSLIKHLPEDIRAQYTKLHKDKIDFTITINNSSINYDDVKNKRYSIHNVAQLINDLRGCVGVIDDVWYLKTLKKEQAHIVFMNEDKLCKKLKTYKPFKETNKITVYSIVSSFSNYFQYKEAGIFKDNTEKNINLFQGFKYNEIDTNDFTMLEPFLNHIKNIICAGSEEKYNYIMSWYANIFQNITVKNGTIPIIYGAQGSGKSFAVEVFSELIGNYALSNVDDLDKVFGKFNGLISQNIYININEPPEATEKFAFGGKIKSKLTQKDQVQETKGVDSIDVVSWANYSMTTNNPSPLREEKGDRRVIYFETDNSKCGDETYFNELCKPIQPVKQGAYNKEFMGILLHYMRTQIDVSDFNPERLIREINGRVNVSYNEQLERQYEDLNAVERYVVDNYKDFVNGITPEYIEACMKLPGYTVLGIQKKLNDLCEVGRRNYKSASGKYKKERVYTLKSRTQKPDLYNIIDYINYVEQPKDEVDKKNNIEIDEEL